MKKVLIIIMIGVFMQLQGFGHAWTMHRRWCGGFFHQKYQAFAQNSALALTYYSSGYTCSGRYVGTWPYAYWYTTCSHSDRGCSRPRVADCNTSGYVYDYHYWWCWLWWYTAHYYWAHARAEYNIGSIHLYQNSWGRGYAGYVDSALLDSTRFNRLDTTGTSLCDVTGDVDIDASNNLVITGLTGNVEITRSTDQYSTLKIIVFTEYDTDTTDTTEVNAENGIFRNVVYSAQVNISNGKMETDGFFSSLSSKELSEITDPDNYGLNLNDISTKVDLSDIPLEPNQHLTVVTMVDGGFDASSTIVGHPKPGRSQINNVPSQLSIYPNPAVNSVNCDVYATSDNEQITIKAFDLVGRDLGQIYQGTLHNGANRINNIDISGLPQGVDVLEVQYGNNTVYRKITVNR